MGAYVIIRRSIGFDNYIKEGKPIGVLPFKDFGFGEFLELSHKDLTTRVKDKVLNLALKKTADFEECSKMMKIYHRIKENRLCEETDKHGRKYVSYYDFNGFFVTYSIVCFNSLI